MTLDPTRLEGRRIWITGATGRLGRPLALAAAAAGAELVLTARSAEALEELAEEVRQAGGYAAALVADVSRDQDVRQAAESIGELVEGLDALVGLASVRLDQGPLIEATAETLNRSLAVNLRGAWLCARAALPLMAGGGRIVHVLCEGDGAFAISQAALAALSQILAGELRSSGILVNAIDPAPFDEASIEAILALATLDDDGPTGGLFDKTLSA